MGVAFIKPPLFVTIKSFIWFCVVLFILLALRLGWLYGEYQEFIKKPFYYTYVKVLNSYSKTKNGKTYQVLKLKSDYGFIFYTTSHQKKSFILKRLRLQIFPTDEIRFIDYLGTFYVKSRIKKEENLSVSLQNTFIKNINTQHVSPFLQEFFNAIFFATPISKRLREKISLLGVSHLVALSGFHLGILWGLVYGVIVFIYGFFQQKFFPYRYAYLDIGLLTLFILGYYVWFVESPDSLVRSYAMLVVGWGLLVLGVELVSFKLLVSIGLSLFLLFPSLMVSFSFWFSMSGVFYIFLLLRYTKKFPTWSVTLLFIPFGIFTLMLPLVHLIFPITSLFQLLSPFLSLGFIVFYPLAMLFHLLGVGWIFDTELLKLFFLPTTFYEHLLPLWQILLYLLLSLGAIWSKKLFYLLCSVSLGYMVYLFLFVEKITKL